MPTAFLPSERTTSVNLFTPDDLRHQRAFFSQRPQLSPTPLRPCSALARHLGIGELLVKDETARFGLNAFKSAGALFAVNTLLERGEIRAGDTLVCASEGNHGRAVARAAREAQCAARVYMSRRVAAARVQAIESEGAAVELVDGTYDEAVRRMAREAEAHGWVIVSDTSWPGYTEIPRLIMLGYTRIMDEIAEPFDLVFVPAGVGGLLAAVACWCDLATPAGAGAGSVPPTWGLSPSSGSVPRTAGDRPSIWGTGTKEGDRPRVGGTDPEVGDRPLGRGDRPRGGGQTLDLGDRPRDEGLSPASGSVPRNGGLSPSPGSGSVPQSWGQTPRRARVVAVEPASAACVQESARAGRPTPVPGPFDTTMGGLRCGEMSPSVFPAVQSLVDAYVGIEDEYAFEAMRLLARPAAPDPPIECGPSGAAALGGLLAVLTHPDLEPLRTRLGCASDSRIVVIATEGVTDPAVFAQALARH